MIDYLLKKHRKTLENAIRYWGESNQHDKCMEEMGELIQAIIKERLSNNFELKELDNLREEIADCIIVLAQMYLIHNDNGEVDKWLEDKLNRLENRMPDYFQGCVTNYDPNER